MADDFSIRRVIAGHAAGVNAAIEAMLSARQRTIPEPLYQAMRYSLMAGGKRIRPTLMHETHAACGGKADIMPAALSIECMHTYSLIHDDLPCMDDDDLRRGQPTCHRKYDEATAILAADALQAMSFQLLSELDVSSDIRMRLVNLLAKGGGASGMVGGQILDMLATQDASLLDVERIHIHKTGALLCYCCQAGAILAAADEDVVESCKRYGEAVGLLFQIADDILDATASSQTLGKSAGKDAAQNKLTYVSLMGVAKARQLGEEMLELALEATTPLGAEGKRLRGLAKYILERDQ
ncbi:MAG: polyprenyl synthetase family protein [Mariprofundaceae bacterium]